MAFNASKFSRIAKIVRAIIPVAVQVYEEVEEAKADGTLTRDEVFGIVTLALSLLAGDLTEVLSA